VLLQQWLVLLTLPFNTKHHAATPPAYAITAIIIWDPTDNHLTTSIPSSQAYTLICHPRRKKKSRRTQNNFVSHHPHHLQMPPLTPTWTD
jgi:hypothetical protein